MFVAFGSGKKSTLVRVGERSWFCLKVNKYVVSEDIAAKEPPPTRYSWIHTQH